MRSSSRSPSSACVLTIARSAGVRPPGLLMIFDGILIFPMSWRSATNSAVRRERRRGRARRTPRGRGRRPRGYGCRCTRRRPRARRRADTPCHGRRRRARAPGRAGSSARARRPRSARGGAAAGAAPRSLTAEAAAAASPTGASSASIMNTQSSGRHELARVDPQGEPFARDRDPEVARELGDECDGEHAPGSGVAVRLAEREEDRSRGDRVPGVADDHRDALERKRAAGELRKAAEHEPERDRERTTPAGSRKSIGTRTTSVGVAPPLPTSNSIREVIANAPTRKTSRSGERSRPLLGSTASREAATRNPIANAHRVVRSRPPSLATCGRAPRSATAPRPGRTPWSSRHSSLPFMSAARPQIVNAGRFEPQSWVDTCASVGLPRPVGGGSSTLKRYSQHADCPRSGSRPRE